MRLNNLVLHNRERYADKYYRLASRFGIRHVLGGLIRQDQPIPDAQGQCLDNAETISVDF